MAGGLLGDALGLALPFAAEALGIGKVKERAKSFDQSGLYDPNKFEYGGRPGGADEAAERYRRQAEDAQRRQGEVVNYGDAQADRAAAAQARLGMQGMADQMAMRARGQVPSIAQMQADRQMQQAMAAQAAQAASARGAAGLALAQQNAANNVANAQGLISGQAQINAAQERLAAEQAALGAYGAMRGGDQGQQQLDAQQAQYQAQINAAQRQANDAFQLGMTGHERGVRDSQLAAGQNQQGLLAGSYGQAQGTNLQLAQNNANRQFDYYKQAAGSVQGAADGQSAQGLGAGTPPPKVPGRALGGPVTAGAPYLVGEQGPELIVPRSNGFVLPHGVTMGLFDAGQQSPNDHAGSAGAGGASSYQLAGDGSYGMDVLGTLKAQNAAQQAMMADPSGGMQSHGFLGGLFG